MKLHKLLAAVLAALSLLCGCADPISVSQPPYIDLDVIPVWDGEPWLIVDDNTPGFTEADLTTEAFERYSALDALGRCGSAYACVSQALLAVENRGSLASVTPTGWVNREYDFIDGKYLYNRCHLLGFQLTGNDASKRNLITGTRYLNIQGMLPYENQVADHVKENGHHVLYRVTPRFREDELVCRGVQMEAYCVECGSDDPFMFHVFCYNVQPGVLIDYETGESEFSEIGLNSEKKTYILNTASKKFHDPKCTNAENISDKNREKLKCTREELIYRGYEPCGVCKP
ncbi:MAG: DNA/RNA non-specific endonuclease [Oscillospiraceae bacterium]|nr:DNA/RNA non-specific endonuclease [Oscillospiraceae bacterium]